MEPEKDSRSRHLSQTEKDYLLTQRQLKSTSVNSINDRVHRSHLCHWKQIFFILVQVLKIQSQFTVESVMNERYKFRVYKLGKQFTATNQSADFTTHQNKSCTAAQRLHNVNLNGTRVLRVRTMENFGQKFYGSFTAEVITGSEYSAFGAASPKAYTTFKRIPCERIQYYSRGWGLLGVVFYAIGILL